MEPQYTTAEERINWLTHGIGAILSTAGLVVLIVCATVYGNVWHILSFSIFGITLIILYTASTFYHNFIEIKDKRLLRILDHSAIFILIAGTYTPFMLVSLRGAWGWSIFAVVWVTALLGIILKTFFTGRFEKISLAVYVTMGWLCVIAWKEIIANVPLLSIVLLFIGGLLYTFGVIFYAWRKLPYNHGIWHLFVLTGSIFHYFSVLFILLVT